MNSIPGTSSARIVGEKISDCEGEGEGDWEWGWEREALGEWEWVRRAGDGGTASVDAGSDTEVDNGRGSLEGNMGGGGLTVVPMGDDLGS